MLPKLNELVASSFFMCLIPVVVLLNKGSIHSSMTLNDDCSGSVGLREDFAKQCFETLLEFSLLDSGLEAAVRTPGKVYLGLCQCKGL